MTDHEYHKLIEVARAEGRHDGSSRAEWIAQEAFGGRATKGEREAAENIIKMSDDGDPALYDMGLYPDLSGQWADEENGNQLFRRLLDEANIERDDEDHDVFTEVLDEYEFYFCQAAEDKLVEMARNFLAQ